ncbi:MAG TPA: recombinase family protein, partial [Nitrolancea sp.]|nr:recombinase family protein [Nitrolancea sp.]
MRAGIYFRVSSEEQVDGYSLDAQQRALLDYCAAREWTVVEEYADEGKSARTDKLERRPAFKRMMVDAQAGALDVVVVHKIDRFARNIRVTFECLELLARYHVAFVAVAQPDLDYTRAEGRLFMGMMATLAQYYSDNLSQETKKGKAERKTQGLYNGHIPFGMIKGPDGVPVANPDTIAGLRLAFQQAAKGQSDRQIAQALNLAGYRTTGLRTGKPELFSKDTVRTMLQNHFYLGELPGERPANAAPVQHQPVIGSVL